MEQRQEIVAKLVDAAEQIVKEGEEAIDEAVSRRGGESRVPQTTELHRTASDDGGRVVKVAEMVAATAREATEVATEVVSEEETVEVVRVEEMGCWR